MTRHVFVTGGTGYVGRPLVAQLAARGHRVRALVRQGSERKLPEAVEAVKGDALDSSGWARDVAPADTLVHLVGTPHPSPSKGAEFRAVDLPSIKASVAAAVAADVRHFVYVSVAHPAPIMHDYIAVRTEGEELLRKHRLNATILRPWYVLGQGHWWPYALVPLYAIARRLPSMREGALRLGLVTHAQMLRALIAAVESPAAGIRVVEVPEIAAGVAAQSPQ